MDKKYLVLPAVLVVAAAVVAAVRLWPSPMKDLRAQNLCLGMLGEKTAGLLNDGKGGRVAVDEDKNRGAGVDPTFSTICLVNREPGEGLRGQAPVHPRRPSRQHPERIREGCRPLR